MVKLEDEPSELYTHYRRYCCVAAAVSSNEIFCWWLPCGWPEVAIFLNVYVQWRQCILG